MEIQLDALALDLVRIPSVSGSEGLVLMFLEKLFQSCQWPFQRIAVGEGRWNLLVGERPRTLLTTHVDTVPGGPPARIEDGVLWGRGSCDAKGIAAAMICALADLRAKGRTDVGLLLVVGEETTSDGAKTAARAMEKVEWFINGEPTEMKFVAAQRGVVAARLETTGVAAHSGYPHLGRSAICELLDVLQSLRQHEWPVDAVVGPTTMNVGVIEGGTAPNVVAGRAAAEVLFRVSTSAHEVAEALSRSKGPHTEVMLKSMSDPQRMHVPAGRDAVVVGFGSDVPHLRPIGTPLMVGPGSIHVAHTDHEHVALAELAKARELYRELAAAL